MSSALQVGAAVSRADSFRITNGPCVFEASLQFLTNLVFTPRAFSPPPTNLPPDIRRAMVVFLFAQQTTVRLQPVTNSIFDHFLPESLNYLVWTNVISQTNGRGMGVWSTRSRPPGWPQQPPQATWNQHSLIWGLAGLTALSPSWEGEGNPGQIPVTALTRRHGYTRGHDMGPTGFHTTFTGKRVWFLTTDNQVVERTIVREVVRTMKDDAADYTIFLFNKELPVSIQPMRVTKPTDVFSAGLTRYKLLYGVPAPLFMTEQTGAVSAGIPGFSVDIRKGGDSGSPNMLPMPGELVFVSGRSTSGATAAMQADMDELCRLEGIRPAAYQLQWVDLSMFPEY